MYSILKIRSLTCAAIAAAMLGIATPPALAQQAQTADIVTFDLFTGDTFDLIPGEASKFLHAARKAQAPDGCTLGRITMFVPEGEDLIWLATGGARRDAVLQLLNVNGIDPSRFFADVLPFGRDDTGNDAQLEYSPSDNDPPKLTVTSMPEKGKKVRANQRITVKAIASDDTNRWQTGIKSIDLTSEGGGPFGFQDYSQPPTTCQSPPAPRTLQGVYTVPANPPPLVRLRAAAKDFAGNEIDLLANFPTGDWYGRIDWRIPFPSGRLWGRLDLTFDYDGQGNLKGRMAGDSHVETQPRGEFCGMTTQTPAKNSANLVGQYTPGTNAMSLRVADPQIEQGQFSMCAAGPDGGPLPMSGQAFEGSGPLGQPGLAQLLNSLTVKADGSVEASGEWPVSPASPTPMTLHMKLTLHRAQN